ncbi:OLC1v1005054C1 [Oldenlandia corymbosa var. corymbosa]|uniref:OLC1v1005054C1 n=1 Tax=Oldenlandia corymbosa var. corymbosa TaxID=529605 RepID=A0AAV1DF10_OLDCO|nr:OLC1v1005054C1 [Oldenlandia corymbosa var. corymbosa]
MSTSSTTSISRSEESRCIPLASLNDKCNEWCVKVVVAEKTPIRRSAAGDLYQKLLFIDEEHTKIQCNVFQTDDVNKLNDVIQLYNTYYIGNAKVIPTNRRCNPMTLSLWEEFIDIEGHLLVDNIHKKPIIMVMRLTAYLLLQPEVLSSYLIRQQSRLENYNHG